MAAPPSVNREPGQLRVFPFPLSGSTNNMSAATGANSAAAVTLAAVAPSVGGSANAPPVMVGGFWWSYSGSPTGGNAKVQVGANSYIDIDITAGGPGFFPFPAPLALGAGTQVVLTLAAGGSGVTGKCGFHAWQEL